jgi:hypothetical protein
MNMYRHTQRGSIVLTLLGAGMLLIAIGASIQGGNAILLVVMVILLVAALMFASLTVEISGGMLKLSFGPGLLHKRVRVADMHACSVVQNPWWYGWGIRLTPHGWLYNVSGFSAVEITLKSGRRFRIGTDEPEQLCQAVQQAIADVQSSPL